MISGNKNNGLVAGQGIGVLGMGNICNWKAEIAV
jgi:hypothetical protein